MISRAYSDEFFVDGTPLLSPDRDVNITENDLDSSDTGRDESGIMHRIVVREGVRTWGPFNYAILTADDYQYIKSLFKGKAHFTFTFKDADGTEVSTLAYCSKRSITLQDSATGYYKNLAFNIIEC